MALETVATLALMCDGRDFGVAMGDAGGDAAGGAEGGAGAVDAGRPKTGGGGMQRGYDPTLFLYEHVPGGTGLSERVYEQQVSLLASALDLIARCPCDAGCPACVGPSDATVTPTGELLTRKALARDLLKNAVPARTRASLAWRDAGIVATDA